MKIKTNKIKTKCACCDEEAGLCEPCDCEDIGKEE